jgi:nucleotide-binding universal stress UspA family protein
MYQKIVLAYNGADPRSPVLQQGAELALLCGAQLYILSIANTTGAMALAQVVGPADVWSAEQQEMRLGVEAALGQLRAQGLQVQACVRSGDPALEIVAYAREIGADLVVLGHTSKNRVSRWLQGSVGGKLLELLPCSLLVAGAGD